MRYPCATGFLPEDLAGGFSSDRRGYWNAMGLIERLGKPLTTWQRAEDERAVKTVGSQYVERAPTPRASRRSRCNGLELGRHAIEHSSGSRCSPLHSESSPPLYQRSPRPAPSDGFGRGFGAVTRRDRAALARRPPDWLTDQHRRSSTTVTHRRKRAPATRRPGPQTTHERRPGSPSLALTRCASAASRA